MSDNRRRARELQRARAAERACRSAVKTAMLDLATFAARAAANVGPFATVDIDVFRAGIANAHEAASDHARASERLAELEGPVKL